MYNGRTVLALIPARAGSKGLPGKNIINLAGRPLISYSIEAGLKSKYVDSVVVSTDGDEIASKAIEYGAEVPFMRPAELAGDKTETIEVVLHAIQTLRDMGRHYDDLVLLQPTQPLRTSDDIDGSLETYYSNNREALVSVCTVGDHPLLVRSIDCTHRLQPLLNMNSTCRRQDMDVFYRVNGCVYINEVRSLTRETSFNDNRLPFVMERVRSVDIDEMIDLRFAECLLDVSRHDGLTR